MEINTRYHGVRCFENKDVLFFKKGLPGFENYKKFILFALDEQQAFSVLHSIEDENIGIIVTSPYNIKADYEVDLDDSIAAELQLETPEEALIINTVTLDSEVENVTVNLKAPIIINLNKCLGQQIILDRDDYKIKTPLIGR